MKYIIYLLLLAIGMSCKPTHDFNHFRTKKLDPECEAFWTGFTKYLKKDKDGFLNLEQIPKDSTGEPDFITYIGEPLRAQDKKGYNCFYTFTSQDIKKLLGEPHYIYKDSLRSIFIYYMKKNPNHPWCPEPANFKMKKKYQKRHRSASWNPFGACMRLKIEFNKKGYIDNVRSPF